MDTSTAQGEVAALTTLVVGVTTGQNAGRKSQTKT